jgi:hypothetical protein
MLSVNKNKLDESLHSAIIFCCAILLAIWCLRNSIALRNILLILGSILAILIILRQNRAIQDKSTAPIKLYQYVPIGLSIGLLFWVILHQILFTSEITLQLQELKGTWLRSGLALLTGSVLGLALRNHHSKINLLWLGIYVSFSYLLVHYLVALKESNDFFMPDYYFSSPFGNKINTVLMGCLFIAGVCGESAKALSQKKMPSWLFIAFWLSGIALVLFSYTTIIDTRNGIGIALILISSWGAFFLVKCLSRDRPYQALLPIIVTIGLIGFFTQQHLSINKGWAHFFQDIEVGIQIDKFSNWQNINKFGYPNTADGSPVYPNNYERAAWATVGVKTIQSNPLGFGLLEHSLGYLIKKEYPNATVLSSHSAWVDFGLAFGIPGLVLILVALLSLILLAVHERSKHSLTVIWIVTSLLLIFTVAETSSKHAIEILFFFIGLLTLLITDNKAIFNNHSIELQAPSKSI